MDVIWLIFLAAMGACVGSFLNVVIYRLPRGQSIVFPGSHCPSCGRAIRWHDNLPLVSWLVLRGRCRFCKVKISPRYLVVEAITALLVGGLFAWYYLTDLRSLTDFGRPGGTFAQTWPTYTAHAVLLCGLLACSAVDIEKWIVPLEVCWFVSLVGIVALTASPPAATLLPRVSATTGAMGLAALVGLLVALLLLRWGVIQRSFLDADDKPVTEDAKPQAANKPTASQRRKKRAKNRKGKKARRAANPAATKPKPKPRITAVAATAADGINPRREILREVVFLAPAILLAVAAWLVLKEVPAAGAAWRRLHIAGETGRWARHLGALEATVHGYLIGGLWIWGIRILGTLGFGKEAMGLGDVHILAAVGACCGWLVPSVAFFLAPIFGLLWAIYLWTGRKQRELPYGPWLAVATLVVMLFHDPIMKFLEPYRRALG